MGAVLPTAVTPVVVERHGGALFRIGFAEMNGWRKNMEDAHVIVMKDTWGFFGVFDGHGGDQCSNFVMQRLTKELEDAGAPRDDAAMKELMLRLDREFLATGQPSGSTGTFAVVTPPAGGAGKCQLRVGNIGDSRVLLGRADGSIVEGPGTDGGLTTDHKPDYPDERKRIERTGGHVEFLQGVARVNGDLAVSRSFGDAPHKQTGGPEQEEHPVSACPELLTTSCDSTDFLVIVCDGISEGDFPNREVVKLAAEELRSGGDKPDPGAAAASVCRKALASGSKDNLSCMIVLLGGGEPAGPERALLSGPFSAPEHGGFRKAYEAMAKHAGLTLAEAVELRYDDVRRERLSRITGSSTDQSEGGNCSASGTADDGPFDSLRRELLAFGDGPPSDLAHGSDERTKWFSDWLDGHNVKEDPDPSNMSAAELLHMLEGRPDILAMAQAQGIVPMRLVRVAAETQLRSAFEAIGTLKWSDEHAQLCGKHGVVIFDDASDGTSRVKFPNLGLFAWLPASALIEVDSEVVRKTRLVRVAPAEDLQPAVEANSALKWVDDLKHISGQLGLLVREDESDGTSQVQFPPPIGGAVWLPSCCLTDAEPDGEDGREPGGSDQGSDQDAAKRPRTG
mmetsp:Transcript_90915/g.266196  ORF Transcript_90915/g.266196 Transcript_90915/m.266196 type:complete len:622 (-) Transcript_90915:72-1937(-)